MRQRIILWAVIIAILAGGGWAVSWKNNREVSKTVELFIDCEARADRECLSQLWQDKRFPAVVFSNIAGYEMLRIVFYDAKGKGILPYQLKDLLWPQVAKVKMKLLSLSGDGMVQETTWLMWLKKTDDKWSVVYRKLQSE